MVGRIWSLFSRRLCLVHRHVSWRSAISHVDGEIFVLFSCREIRWLIQRLNIVQSLCTPLSAASRLVQIRTMHVSQNSESVSVLTWSIAVYTCVSKRRYTKFLLVWIEFRFFCFSIFSVRIFITLDRGFDAPLLANYSVSLILNLAVITLALKLRRPSKKNKKIEWH
jgi:uncharacterized protein with PQ loop repeat